MSCDLVADTWRRNMITAVIWVICESTELDVLVDGVRWCVDRCREIVSEWMDGVRWCVNGWMDGWSNMVCGWME